MEDQPKQSEGVAGGVDEADHAVDWPSDLCELLLADGYDAALVGLAFVHGETVALYDAAKCIGILVKRDGMTEEEAREYFDYNTLQAYVGPRTPAFAIFGRLDEQGDQDLLASVTEPEVGDEGVPQLLDGTAGSRASDEGQDS